MPPRARQQLRALLGRTHTCDRHVAQMPARQVIVEVIVVVDEITRKRRLIAATDAPRAVALQTVDILWPGLPQAFRQRGIGRLAQLLAGRPKKAAATLQIDVAVGLVQIADGDAAVAVAQLKRKADSVFIGHRLPVDFGIRPGVRHWHSAAHGRCRPASSASKSKAPVGAGRSASSMRPCSSNTIFEISVGPGAGGTTTSSVASMPNEPSGQSPTDQICKPAATA